MNGNRRVVGVGLLSLMKYECSGAPAKDSV